MQTQVSTKDSFCAICKKVFAGKTNGKYCSDECKKIAKKLQYQNSVKKKQCIYCDSCFYGKKQERLCPNCKRKHLVKYQEIQVQILCRKCKCVIRTESRFATRNKKQTIGQTCDGCKSLNKRAASERLKINNPMFKPENRAKVASTISGEQKQAVDYITPKNTRRKMSKGELKHFFSERMKNNNPMQNEKIRCKVSRSLKEGYKSGRIAKIKGVKHWLWKGNRDRCQTIRSRLFPVWTRLILERDNFTCCHCGHVGGRLEVHHSTLTFDEIVSQALRGRRMIDLSDEEFEDLSNTVVSKHKYMPGVTCCIRCHKKLDSRRH